MARRNWIRRRRRITGLALGFAALAVVSSAQAAQRPDDRAGALGVGTAPAALDQSDVVSRYLNNTVYRHAAALPGTVAVYQHSPGIGTMPDSGIAAYQHSPGVGTPPETLAPVGETPGGAPLGPGRQPTGGSVYQSPPSAVTQLPQTPLRPDNRPGIRGVGPSPTAVAAPSSGSDFSWSDAGAGAGMGFALALLLIGALVATKRGMSGPRPGAVAAG